MKAFALDALGKNPNAFTLLTLDSMPAIWSMLVDEADRKAKWRGKEDPTMDLRNKASASGVPWSTS